jgi:hypothetical protein
MGVSAARTWWPGLCCFTFGVAAYTMMKFADDALRIDGGFPVVGGSAAMTRPLENGSSGRVTSGHGIDHHPSGVVMKVLSPKEMKQVGGGFFFLFKKVFFFKKPDHGYRPPKKY